MAEAGADGVDEHEVRLVERAVCVVDQLIGRRRRVRGVGRHDALGAEGAHVDPHRRRARAAVVGERDRPARRVGDTALGVRGEVERADGLVGLDALETALTERTLIVSVVAAPNKISVIQPLTEIGALCRSRGILLHTDAAQALGKIPLDVEAMKIDLMSMSGHKLYGPKGVGALYVRRRPRVRLTPLIDGGGQERGIRSGTLPTPLCVGFGKACAIAAAEMTAEAARLKDLCERLFSGLRDRIPGLHLNGDTAHRLPGSLNVSVPGTTAAELIEACPSIAISTGSACTSATVEPSYVLRALGLGDDRANASIRLGLGRFTTANDVEYAADALADAAKRLRVKSAGRAPT